jgi:hypothetical protein
MKAVLMKKKYWQLTEKRLSNIPSSAENPTFVCTNQTKWKKETSQPFI